ncbi:MAG: peptidylprolyl isomerase [Chromatiales bacterium]|nr:peptidylprolyl isomerase [Chromatiales bacterium]
MSSEVIVAGKFVQFTYEIVDQAGQMVEKIDTPVGYVHGGNSELIPRLEQELAGHKPGDQVVMRMSPDEGFGPRREELTFTDDLDNVPPEFRHIGAEIQMHNDKGEVKTFRVSHIGDGKLTADGNHPLAGQTMTFRINVVSVREASEAEKAAEGAEEPPPTAH